MLGMNTFLILAVWPVDGPETGYNGRPVASDMAGSVCVWVTVIVVIYLLLRSWKRNSAPGMNTEWASGGRLIFGASMLLLGNAIGTGSLLAVLVLAMFSIGMMRLK